MATAKTKEIDDFFEVDSGPVLTTVKIAKIAKAKNPEVQKTSWGETSYDVEITYSSPTGEWTTDKYPVKKQITVKNWNKQFKVVSVNDYLMTKWNGYRNDFVAIMALYKLTHEDVKTRKFNLKDFEGFEFQAKVVEGENDKGKYKFIDWTDTLFENGVAIPDYGDDGVYDKDGLVNTQVDTTADKKEEDDLSDFNLPF